ncbi:SGNH/GDSL hydrolase family protein [Mycobacterium yunnanensis]|uniref:SGNH/GDSL hydrolase family protein n=1 Tax=Mycobacterium yunnanensis TaxID=368477 RepID=A0A9X2YXJ1_9MYCO|nr:SGNH/GDSL hydrolase family protein [Mycobacterium yunnanensis]MCV7419456.1 SGNH/GDSL hydrolase family protein [Mycobacterium yunnanensis]
MTAENAASFAAASQKRAGWRSRLAISIAAAGLMIQLAVPGVAAADPLPSCSDQGWLGVWAAAPSDASAGDDDFDRYDMSMNPKSVVRDETIRAILTPTFDGSTARVRLSNRFGSVPVTFAQAAIARRASGPALVPDTTAPLTFAGDRSVTVAPEHDVLSDPVQFTVQAFEPLAVSLYVAGDVGKATEHAVARQTSYLTAEGAGDHTADADGSAFTQRTTSRPFVSGLEVQAPLSDGAVAAVGDSITDGYQAVPAGAPEAAEGIDADGRWPDDLARRLAAAGRPLSVLNLGIAGNRVLQDSTVGGQPDIQGPALIRRLDADVLAQSGVTTVIWLEGINDLLMPPNATVDQLTGGYRDVIDRLHSRGLRVLQGTLTPAGGSAAPPNSDAVRQEVNDWIRQQSPADGVVDFEAAVRDPADPSRINPAYDGSDHLHFNLAGYRAMADAVPLDMLADRACS